MYRETDRVNGCFHGLIWIIFFSALIATPLFGGNYEKGSELFLFNKPAEAQPFLERAVIEDPSNAEAYYRLGVVYEQLKLYDKSITSLRSAMERNYATKAELLGRIAAVYGLKGDIDQCIAINTQALEQKPDYPTVLLNRANAWFRKDKLEEAVADYRKFIEVDPQNPLKPDVIRMIQAILGLKDERLAAKKAEEDRKAAEEVKRLEDERQKLLALERQKQEEAKRLADEAARKKKLDDLFSSLNDASTEQMNLSAGTEEVQNKQSDLNLEE